MLIGTSSDKNVVCQKTERTAHTENYSSRLTPGPLSPFFYYNSSDAKYPLFRKQKFRFIDHSVNYLGFQYKWVNCIHCKLLHVYLSHCYNNWKMGLTLLNRASRIFSSIL